MLCCVITKIFGIDCINFFKEHRYSLNSYNDNFNATSANPNLIPDGDRVGSASTSTRSLTTSYKNKDVAIMDREDDDVESRLLMKECERELAAVMQLRWYAEEEMITNAQIKQSFELKKKNSVRNHSDKKPQKRRVSCNLQYSEETIHGRIAATTVRRQSF